MSDPPTGEPVQIHKYPNRRYYNTSSSTYVTLEQLREMVRAGRDIRVSDSRSGQDITARVLAQIVLETEPLKLDVIPLKLLHELVRMNVRAAGGWWEEYYNQAVRAISETGRSIETGVGRAMRLPDSPQAVLPDLMKLAWGPLAPPSFLFGREDAPGAAPPPPSNPTSSNPERDSAAEPRGGSSDSAALLQQVRQMAERLAALEKRLEKKPDAPKPLSRPAKKRKRAL